MVEPNESYWGEYSNLQFVKHKIIREYLNGWFPKLGFWAGKILYVDTHAGRGRHLRGQEGSPIVALKTFLEHSFRDRILTKSEVQLMFMERDEKNIQILKNEINSLGELPSKISYTIYNRDSFELLNDLTKEFEQNSTSLAPCFMFIDPYGFKIPYTTLAKLKEHPRSELLINVMWRELDMAICNKSLESVLQKSFGNLDSH